MEPEHLNPNRTGEDRLDEWLRDGAAASLPDDGFSTRVLAALPPRRARASAGRMWILPAAGVVAGLALVISRGGASTGVDVSPVAGLMTDLGSALPKSGLGLALVVVVALLAVAELFRGSPEESPFEEP